MSARRNKRRRIDADLDSIASEQPHSSPLRKQLQPDDVLGLDFDHPDSLSPQEAPPDELDVAAFAKEREIWDAFREEHYELLEQLPLSLHRAFTLIQELDQQAQQHLFNLTPAILKYVSLRRALADPSRHQSQVAATGSLDPTVTLSELEACLSSRSPRLNGIPVNGKANSLPPQGTTSHKARTPSLSSRSLSVVTESSNSSRELLTCMAQSVEEISRASVEKQYLAQHVYDLVDRYIRDLDRSIKEQEASISLGLRPGTHPASIMLPELVVPQFKRTRTTLSPPPLELHLPEDTLPIEIAFMEPPAPPQVEEPPPSSPQASEELEGEEVEIIDVTEPTETVTEPISGPIQRAPPRKRKGRKRRKSTKQKPEQTAEAEEGAPDEPATLEADEEMVPEPQLTLTLKIPAQAPAVVPALEIVDPNEPRYCFCNQVSFGEMIACDNPTCTREWFHMGCVGVTGNPKGKWYCRECAESVKKRKGKRRTR